MINRRLRIEPLLAIAFCIIFVIIIIVSLIALAVQLKDMMLENKKVDMSNNLTNIGISFGGLFIIFILYKLGFIYNYVLGT